jgi:hypothetical protein
MERWTGIGWNYRPACVESAAGLYQIRLNIALDPKITPYDAELIDDLKSLVVGLRARVGGIVNAWYVRSAGDRPRFWIFEDEATGMVIGCLARSDLADWGHGV